MGPVLIVVSRDDQLAYVYRNGIEIARTTVSTGMKAHTTPTGCSRSCRRHADHYSNLYKNAPMPYMQRLTWKGIALHAGTHSGLPRLAWLHPPALRVFQEALQGDRHGRHGGHHRGALDSRQVAETITLEDLCRRAGVGCRTLQRSFLSYYSIPPFGFLKIYRLNTARRRLVAGNPHENSVTSVASKCGFTHLGRFSVDYRGHFGESPKETLAETKVGHPLTSGRQWSSTNVSMQARWAGSPPGSERS